MAIADYCRGRVLKGHEIPYGTFTGDEKDREIKHVYYNYGYRRDEDMPPLPCLELDEQVVDSEEEVARKEELVYLEKLLDGLTHVERKVICMRFGIGVSADYTLEEVGQVFELSRERIRQLEARALRKLKHPKLKLWAILHPEDIPAGYPRDQSKLRERMLRIEMIHQGFMWMTRQLDKGIILTKRDTATFWIDHIFETDQPLYWHFHAEVNKRLDHILTYRLCAPYADGRAQT